MTTCPSKTTLLKTLVGSRAHGLHEEESDYDYRSIYVEPTSEILSLNHKYKGSSWIEGVEDNTSYEIGHFLHLATKANPSVLEILVSDEQTETTIYGEELRKMLPYLVDPKDAFNAFTGYSYNQRKKMLENKDGRALKFGVAYLRTLYNLVDLLELGRFNLKVTNKDKKYHLQSIKAGVYTSGEILDLCDIEVRRAAASLTFAENKQDLVKVNGFLIRVRKHYF